MKSIVAVALALAFSLQGSTTVAAAGYGNGRWWKRNSQPPTPSPTFSPTSSPTLSPTTTTSTEAPSSAAAALVAAEQQNYTTIRIELDPEVSSIVGNCTYNFTERLQIQISNWFVDAIASQSGSYPPISNNNNNPGGSLFRIGYSRGQKWGKNNNRQLESDQEREEEETNHQNAVSRATPTEQQQDKSATIRTNDRMLQQGRCSTTSCSNCCQSGNYCTTSCSVSGTCKNCKNGRNLRGYDVEDNESRMLGSGAHRWWWLGDNDKQDDVANSIQFAAQRWLHQNDPTRCMGNPWRLIVLVNYF